ncbi:MAG: hypothetical protein ACYCSX_15030 [Acidimicrobiales bacterium]|jgi:hypothetical protein
MSTFGVAVLLVLSAAAELFGTVTVALTYARGHRLAEQLVREIATEDAVEMAKSPADQLLDQMSPGATAFFQVKIAEQRLRSLRERVSDQLTGRPILTAGLIAYGLGAVLGLAAGLIALYH